MENLHVKQQNVLRRKMEEAMASNKRLREVLEKQKNARKISRDVIDNKGGLAGAAERMRSVVTQVLNLYLFFLLNIFSQFFFLFKTSKCYSGAGHGCERKRGNSKSFTVGRGPKDLDEATQRPQEEVEGDYG